MTTNPELNFLRWADIRAEWGWIKPRVDAIRDKCSKDWRTEDVYAACVYNKAQLFVGCGEWEHRGFFILQVELNPYTLQNSLFIWLAQGETQGLYPVFYSELRSIARFMNCSSIRFKSPRQGWNRAALIRPVMTEFELPMEDDTHV